MAKKKKETRIAEEKERLLRIFADMDENKLSTVAAIIDRTAFITVSLEDLEKDLLRDGWIEEYQNGTNQSGVKKSAAADCHIALTKHQNSLVKQHLDIVPAAQRKSKLQELMMR